MQDSHVLTEQIIGAAMKVHRTLGPGFLESVYRNALALELRQRGLAVDLEWPLKVRYEHAIVGEFAADLLVEQSVIVELKATHALAPAHEVQTVNYLTATNLPVGLLINFGAASLQFKRKHRAPLPHPPNPVDPVPKQTPAHPGASPVRLLDISRPIYTGSPHWPSDTPTDFSFSGTFATNATCNVGRLSLSVHNGSHADAPFHYNNSGATIDALAPDLFVGPARVIDARGRTTFTAELFAGLSAADLAATPRVLFRTDTWLDPTIFPTAWPLFDPALPAWLAAHGVKLIGLDVPSVDTLTSKGMPIHHLIDDAGLLILESLDLREAEPGVYELIALPLKIRGGDGSPVRAVLRPLA